MNDIQTIHSNYMHQEKENKRQNVINFAHFHTSNHTEQIQQNKHANHCNKNNETKIKQVKKKELSSETYLVNIHINRDDMIPY